MAQLLVIELGSRRLSLYLWLHRCRFDRAQLRHKSCAKKLCDRPPDLAFAAHRYTAPELFWIIKNGIKMTGMPAWADHSDEEIWATAAFLQKLGGGMTEQQYGELIRASMTRTLPAGGHHH